MAAVARIDERMREIRQQQPLLQGRRDTKAGALADMIGTGDDGYSRDITRIQGEVADMQAALDSLGVEGDRLNDERIEVEATMLCDPERF